MWFVAHWWGHLPYCIYLWQNCEHLICRWNILHKPSHLLKDIMWYTHESPRLIPSVFLFIQYFARNWPWYSLRGLHIRITWFSSYGIGIPLFSLYGIHFPLLPYMVIHPIVLGMALLWAAMDSSLSQGPLLWRHNDLTVIVSRNTRGRERDTQQRLDNANARWLQTVNR